MDMHSGPMVLVHWIGVVLALPATAAVLADSWRYHRAAKRREKDS